jgi:hypothetical protein
MWEFPPNSFNHWKWTADRLDVEQDIVQPLRKAGATESIYRALELTLRTFDHLKPLASLLRVAPNIYSRLRR